MNAINLIKLSNVQLNFMRSDDSAWESFLDEVMLFCNKHDIEVKCMNDIYQESGRARRGQEEKTNLHRFRVEIFSTMIDLLINELNDRFNTRNTKLLLCVACLDLSDEFASFNKEKLVQLAQLYPSDFSHTDIERLGNQLNTYILIVRGVPELKFVKGISGIAQKLVELKQDPVYFLVYQLLKLALLLCNTREFISPIIMLF